MKDIVEIMLFVIAALALLAFGMAGHVLVELLLPTPLGVEG